MIHRVSQRGLKSLLQLGTPSSKTELQRAQLRSLQQGKMIVSVNNGNQTWASVQMRRTAGLEPDELTFCVLVFPEGKRVPGKGRITTYLLQSRQIEGETLQAAVGDIWGVFDCVELVRQRESKFS